MVAWKSYRKPLVCEFWRQNVLNTIIIIFTKWWQQTSQMTKSKHKYLQNDRNDSQEFWRQYGMKCTKHSFIRHGLEMTCDYVKVNSSTGHKHWTKKYLGPRQESNPWTPKHQTGTLPLSCENLWRAKSFIITEFLHVCDRHSAYC